jgi:hypothetical protein
MFNFAAAGRSGSSGFKISGGSTVSVQVICMHGGVDGLMSAIENRFRKMFASPAGELGDT